MTDWRASRLPFLCIAQQATPIRLGKRKHELLSLLFGAICYLHQKLKTQVPIDNFHMVFIYMFYIAKQYTESIGPSSTYGVPVE